jgi:hypothetical protein
MLNDPDTSAYSRCYNAEVSAKMSAGDNEKLQVMFVRNSRLPRFSNGDINDFGVIPTAPASNKGDNARKKQDPQ